MVMLSMRVDPDFPVPMNLRSRKDRGRVSLKTKHRLGTLQFMAGFGSGQTGIHIVHNSFIGYIESMKVTSKSMYTLHFLCALAIKNKDWPLKPIHLREIAKEYNIPFKFLEQIAILMKSVGLVRGARGKLGGYLLAEPAESITLSRIIKATEGELFPCADIEGGNEIVTSLLHRLFQEGRDLVDAKLASVTLAQIAEKAKQQLEPVPMYYL